MSKIRVHTLGWAGDHAQKPGEEAVGMMHSLVEIDGVLVPAVCAVAVEATGGAFAAAVLRINVSSVEFIRHTEDEWNALAGESS